MTTERWLLRRRRLWAGSHAVHALGSGRFLGAGQGFLQDQVVQPAVARVDEGSARVELWASVLRVECVAETRSVGTVWVR